MIPRPHLLRFLGLRAAALLAILTLARLALTLRFATQAPTGSLAEAMLLGLRFDARVVAILTLAALPFVILHKTSPHSPHRHVRVTWLVVESFIAVALALFIVADFAHYAYLKERLNAGVITLARDAKEATGMVWQSYPVLRIAFALAIFATGAAYVHRRIVRGSPPVPRSLKRHAAHAAIVAVFAGVCIFGRFGQYPLRWSDTANVSPTVAGAMALNPVLHFFDTMAFANKGYKDGDDAAYRTLITTRLGVTTPLATPYERIQKGSPDGLPKNQNVVLVIMESCSGYKSSVFGNPLDPTPVMKHLADNGVSFERHFTAHAGTARGVFTLTTGIPDVQLGNTASRNPSAAYHRFILAEYGFAEKHYFIGGSTRWANVRGVLKGTMPDIVIHEERGLKSPSTDVWGVADGDLLPEAAHTLAKAKKPFFAVIQTASNHRPFSIPEAHLPYAPRSKFPAEKLAPAGFESSEEWDGMRYMDWSIGRLMEEAKRAGWHDDTVFVFVGDHGISGTGGQHMPAMFARHAAFTQGHTPLIYYAPGRLAPARITTPCMQADVLPTLAGFFAGDFKIRCLGRDVRQTPAATTPAAFMINQPLGTEISVFDGRYFATTGKGAKDPVKLYDAESPDCTRDVAEQQPAKAVELGNLARAHYHVAARMLTRNGEQDERNQSPPPQP